MPLQLTPSHMYHVMCAGSPPSEALSSADASPAARVCVRCASCSVDRVRLASHSTYPSVTRICRVPYVAVKPNERRARFVPVMRRRVSRYTYSGGRKFLTPVDTPDGLGVGGRKCFEKGRWATRRPNSWSALRLAATGGRLRDGPSQLPPGPARQARVARCRP